MGGLPILPAEKIVHITMNPKFDEYGVFLFDKQMLKEQIIIPEWDVPENIKSLVTTRQGGYSKIPYDSFNLAEHVGDNLLHVQQNRQKLVEYLPSEPIWLNQVHSNVVVNACTSAIGKDADGSYTTHRNVVSVIMTADCLPVLITNRQGNGVAAIHAGWRGLLNGILEQGVCQLLKASQCQPEDLLVWLGPAIGPEMFEVGDEVRLAFLDKSSNKEAISKCFLPSSYQQEKLAAQKRLIQKKWLADIYQLARIRLSYIGIENFSGGVFCTYKQKEQFYSYRRDGKTGRMASLIWFE